MCSLYPLLIKGPASGIEMLAVPTGCKSLTGSEEGPPKQGAAGTWLLPRASEVGPALHMRCHWMAFTSLLGLLDQHQSGPPQPLPGDLLLIGAAQGLREASECSGLQQRQILGLKQSTAGCLHALDTGCGLELGMFPKPHMEVRKDMQPIRVAYGGDIKEGHSQPRHMAEAQLSVQEANAL